MTEICSAAIVVNQDLCSKCCICHSICPYEAIKRDPTTGEVEVDLQKCQVCGICYSACPSMAIEIEYYDYDSLLKLIKRMQEKSKSSTLVLMCRGNSPSSCEVKEILEKEGVELKEFISLRLPCAGRVPSEFVFKVLNMGIQRIISIQCEDKYCRYKEGTRISNRRMTLGRAVLEQFGLSKDVFKVIRYSRKVTYDTSKCVGCDKCVFICPYKAIEAEPLATPNVLLDKCMGCGACALVCPHQAIEVQGFEFETVLKRYADTARKLKTQCKGPVILVFVCQWSDFSVLDQPEKELSAKNTLTLEIPCFKSLDPVHVISALQTGFDGVMAVVCAPEDCKLQEGKETSERNVAVLKTALKKMELLNRFEVFYASPRCIGQFNQRLEEFCKRIVALPALMVEARASV